MANRKNRIFSEAGRRWLYGIGVAVGAAAVVFGFATNEEVDAVLGVVMAILGLTAATHVGDKGVDGNDSQETV